ncbi:MAG TPA: asparagine synthase C-terminal domain-containing protein [Candidatus Nitrosotenuis sp.]|nr:asparagine synthase C-terminal domain-containing protein [Candidatus Nitrosotenuis sp.]
MLQLDELLEKIKASILQTVPEKKIGIAFSGGVDSATVAKVCGDIGYDVTLLTIGFAGSHDIEFSKLVNELLRMPHKILEIDPRAFEDISKKIRSTIKTENLSWNENSIAFYHVAKLAQSLGLQIVVTANGIDELFCGYNGYRDAIKEGESKVVELMEAKLKNELEMMKAVNYVCSEFGVKIVQPLLSRDFINYAKTIPVSEKIKDENDLFRKHIIRKLALQIGVPKISANARKKALQYGSLIHKALIKSR